jgi:hypothetical protein
MFASKDIFQTASTGGYKISRSVRLRSSASAYLNRTPASASNRQIFTISAWVKRGSLGVADSGLFTAWDGTNRFYSRFEADDKFTIYVFAGGSAYEIATSMVFRDPSAWYHIVLAVDTTQATNTNRMKIYVNGVQQTFTGTYAPQNTSTQWNNTVQQNIGKKDTSGSYFDGYMAEINSIDGQALTPSSFGETNSITGVWQPKKYGGTYGTNGFYLNFSDNSTAAALGTDFSGNSNTWTVNNISVTAGTTYDSMVDSPTVGATSSNYAVLNPLDKNAGTTPSNANLTWTASTPWRPARATFGMTTGKWYWEVTASGANCMVGIGTASAAITDNNYPGKDANGWGYFDSNGNKFNNGSSSAYGASYTTNDVIGVAFDADNGTLTFYKNNTSQGTAFTGLTSGPYFPMIGNEGSTSYHNFGQRPFSYTPPTGFVALNTQNLPTPTISNGASYMAATTYTGTLLSNAVSNAVNGVSFQPDLVWIKSRSAATDHELTDSVRGATLSLTSNSTAAEATDLQGLTAFNSGGFTVGTNTTYNNLAATYVGWQWNAGGSTVTNTSGSISAQVRANPTAGFSVVTYTGNATNGATVGHGLGVSPSMIIGKIRSTTDDWYVWQTAMGDNFMRLNTTAAQIASTGNGVYNTGSFSSTVFALGSGTSMNRSGGTYVAYCFAAVAGYSAFGSYTGNGSTDGPFVYLGFRPRFIMTKCSSAGGLDWHITDTSRYPTNSSTSMGYLDANTSGVEGNYNIYDGLSNGFKIRDNGGQVNTSGGTYIYMAFCENPFKLSLAR